MAHLKGKAKSALTSKHDSISESLAQSFEGIRQGLAGSNGKTKYPLRSSTSAGSLGLGITGGFKFPTLVRRASEMDYGRGHTKRNGSSSTLGASAESSGAGARVNGVIGVTVDEGDFTDLRDPFACPNLKNGEALRTVSQAELSGRESRTGYREDESSFDTDGLSPGKVRGTRMSAWGKLPLPSSSGSSTTANSPMSMRYQRSMNSPGMPSKSPKRSGEKERKSKKTKTNGVEDVQRSSCSGGVEEGYDSDGVFVCEEALIAQQLLKQLDERLWAAAA